MINHIGMYDQCEEMLVRIRYGDAGRLNDLLQLLNTYNKIRIMSVDNNFTGYYGEVDKYYKPIECLQSTTPRSPLGEVESIIEMLTNPNFKKTLTTYDTCIFCHTRGASFNTRWKPQPKHKKRPHFSKFNNWCNIKNHMFTPLTQSFGGNQFAFPIKLIQEWTVPDYLNMFWNNRDLFGPESPIRSHASAEKNIAYGDDNQPYFTNRHAFAWFGYKMNKIYNFYSPNS